MNKYAKIIFLMAVITLIAAISVIVSVKKEVKKAEGSSVTETASLTSASSSPVYLQSSLSNFDSHTIIMNIADAEGLGLFAIYTPSSTLASLQWKYEYSNNRIDWFGETVASSTDSYKTGYIAHASSTPMINRWSPATSIRTQGFFDIPNVNANWIKVSFQNGTSSATTVCDGSLWAELRAVYKGYGN